jgi:hypothetical protein
MVRTEWPCGHSQNDGTPTCVAHMNMLLTQRGTAPLATACAVCGIVGHAAVVAMDDTPDAQ